MDGQANDQLEADGQMDGLAHDRTVGASPVAAVVARRLDPKQNAFHLQTPTLLLFPPATILTYTL